MRALILDTSNTNYKRAIHSIQYTKNKVHVLEAQYCFFKELSLTSLAATRCVCTYMEGSIQYIGCVCCMLLPIAFL